MSNDISAGVHCGDARVPEHFWARVIEVASGCWVWQGSVDPAGYGLLSLTTELREATGLRRTERPHRLFYRMLVGPIPAGRQHHLDHLCRNRLCCNPAHLELVAPRTNLIRGDGAPGKNSRKTTCVRGHDIADPENVIIRIRNGHENRRCATCRRAGIAAAKAKRGAAAHTLLPLNCPTGQAPE